MSDSVNRDESRDDGPRRINVDLDTKLAKRFDRVKEKFGLMHDTEVIRTLITDKYNSLYND